MGKRKSNLLKQKKSLCLCPVCKKHYFSTINSYEICPICGWEDDLVQRKDPNCNEGANKLSLNEALREYHGK